MNALAKATELAEGAYYDERGMADVMRQDATIYAAIAQAQQLERIAVALDAIAASIYGGVPSPAIDNEESDSLSEYRHHAAQGQALMKAMRGE